jgi:hypothetical protein
VGVAGMGQQFAVPVDHGYGTKMQALGSAAAAEFDEGCEVHSLGFCLLVAAAQFPGLLRGDHALSPD